MVFEDRQQPVKGTFVQFEGFLHLRGRNEVIDRRKQIHDGEGTINNPDSIDVFDHRTSSSSHRLVSLYKTKSRKVQLVRNILSAAKCQAECFRWPSRRGNSTETLKTKTDGLRCAGPLRADSRASWRSSCEDNLPRKPRTNCHPNRPHRPRSGGDPPTFWKVFRFQSHSGMRRRRRPEARTGSQECGSAPRRMHRDDAGTHPPGRQPATAVRSTPQWQPVA